MPNWLGICAVTLIASVSGCALLLGQPLPTPKTSKATLVSGTDRNCPAQFPDGTAYQVHYRTLKARWKGQDVFVVERAYYKPETGEFLYSGATISKAGYLRDQKEYETLNYKEMERADHIALLQNGEWADFWAENASVTVVHSNLRFSSLGAAWKYVSAHYDERETGSEGCCAFIKLYSELGEDFFRPESLRWDARPYFYKSLVSVKKVDSGWEVVIRGADEPKRALIVLDQDFKLVTVTRFSAAK